MHVYLYYVHSVSIVRQIVIFQYIIDEGITHTLSLPSYVIRAVHLGFYNN